MKFKVGDIVWTIETGVGVVTDITGKLACNLIEYTEDGICRENKNRSMFTIEEAVGLGLYTQPLSIVCEIVWEKKDYSHIVYPKEVNADLSMFVGKRTMVTIEEIV